MNYPKYPLRESRNSTLFEFTSVGDKGSIQKIIRFSATESENIYNLGFGNKVSVVDKNFTVDDTTINDNGDRDKILATIAQAIKIFTRSYPENYVYFTGNSSSRNRLYRMAISVNLKELSKEFVIFGILYDGYLNSTKVISFDPRENFAGFLIKRK
jgi:hypothetical protein